MSRNQRFEQMKVSFKPYGQINWVIFQKTALANRLQCKYNFTPFRTDILVKCNIFSR